MPFILQMSKLRPRGGMGLPQGHLGKTDRRRLCLKVLNAAAHGCVSGPEPECSSDGYLINPRTMPFLPQAAGLKMALSNCHGFGINCLPQSIPMGKEK